MIDRLGGAKVAIVSKIKLQNILTQYHNIDFKTNIGKFDLLNDIIVLYY